MSFLNNSNGSESLTPRNEYEYLGGVRYNVGTTGWQHIEVAAAPTPEKNPALSQAVRNWAEQKQFGDWAPEKINAVGSKAVGAEVSNSTGGYKPEFHVPAPVPETPVPAESEFNELDEESVRARIDALHATIVPIQKSDIGSHYENVDSDPFEGGNYAKAA